MAIRVFKPRAQAVKYRAKLKVSGATITEDSDVTITINGKAITIQSPGDTAALFCNEIADRLTDLRETIPELAEMTFTYYAADAEDVNGLVDYQDHVLIEAVEAGVPMEISIAAGTPSVDVDVTTEGAEGVSGVYSFYLEDDGNGDAGSFYVRWDLGSGDETSLPIAYNGGVITPLSVEEAIVGGMASVDVGDIEVTGAGQSDDPFVITCTGNLAETTVGEPEILTEAITGGGVATVTTVRGGGPSGDGCGFFTLKSAAGMPNFEFYLYNAAYPSGVSVVTLASNVTYTAGDLQTELEAYFGAGNIEIVGGGSVLTVGGVQSNSYGYHFTGDLAGYQMSLFVTGGSTGTSISGIQAGGPGAGKNESVIMFVKGDTSQTFTITYDGQTTAAITKASALNTTGVNIQSALEALSNLAPGDFVLTLLAQHGSGAGSEYWFGMTFSGTLADTNVGTVSMTATTVTTATPFKVMDGGSTSVSEVQQFYTNATGGSTVITITSVGSTGTIVLPADAATVKAALDAITSNDVDSVTGTGTAGDPYIVTFTSTTNYAQMTLTTANMGTNAVTATVSTVTAGVTATAAVFSVVVNGTGGTVIYEFKGAQTSAIAYNASAGTLQTALEGLASIGSGNVTVSGAGTSGSPYVVTLGSVFAGETVPQLVAYNESLTGTASPTVSITTIQAATGPNFWDNAINWEKTSDLSTGIPQTGDDVRIELGDEEQGLMYGLDQSAVALNSITVMRTFAAGVGLPRMNGNGYPEYRRRALRVDMQGDKKVILGLGDGGGFSLFNIDTGSTQAIYTVYHTGGNLDGTLPCVNIAGTSTSNTLTIYDGDVGTAKEATQTAAFNTVNVQGGRLQMGKGTAISGSLERGVNAVVLSDFATIGGVPVLMAS